MRSAVILGLGSNLGNKSQNLIAAIRMLPLYNLKCSKIYVNPTMGNKGAPSSWLLPFYNMVAVGTVNFFSPLSFLKRIKVIEKAIGRPSNTKSWHPRKIDIDILFWDQSIIKDSNLSIPHPGVLIRDFTIIPLMQIAPNYVHPVTRQKISATKIRKPHSLAVNIVLNSRFRINHKKAIIK